MESGNEEPQLADAPLPPAVAPEQLTMTAETGMLGHPVKVLEEACTLKVQLLRCEPLATYQDKLAGDIPGTVPASGFDA